MEKTTGLDDDETDGSNNSNDKSDPPQEDDERSQRVRKKRARHQRTGTQKKPPPVATSRKLYQRDDRDRQRELNRLSKARCRKRRNELIKNLETENARLAAEYNELNAENKQLRQEFGELLPSPEPGTEQGTSSVGAPVNQVEAGLTTHPSPIVNHNWSAATANLHGQGTLNNASAQWTGPSLETFLANPTQNVVNNIWSSNTVNAYLFDQHEQQDFAMRHSPLNHHYHEQQPQNVVMGIMPSQWPVAAFRPPEQQQDTAITNEAYHQQLAASIVARISQLQQENTSKPKRKYSDAS